MKERVMKGGKSGKMKKSPQMPDMRGKTRPVPEAGSKVKKGVEPSLYTGPKGSKGPARKPGT
jgi:hypothetical protein